MGFFWIQTNTHFTLQMPARYNIVRVPIPLKQSGNWTIKMWKSNERKNWRGNFSRCRCPTFLYYYHHPRVAVFPQDEVFISRLLKLIYCNYELRLWTLLRNYERFFMFRNIMYHVLYIPMYHDTFNLLRQKDNVAEKYLQSDVVSSHFFCTMFDQ